MEDNAECHRSDELHTSKANIEYSDERGDNLQEGCEDDARVLTSAALALDNREGFNIASYTCAPNSSGRMLCVSHVLHKQPIDTRRFLFTQLLHPQRSMYDVVTARSILMHKPPMLSILGTSCT